MGSNNKLININLKTKSNLKYRLMNYLACPICKKFPLDLLVFEKKKFEFSEKIKEPVCDEYCGYNNEKISTAIKMNKKPPCHECLQNRIVDGILTCLKCERWFPIIDEIPHMLPDELRNKKDDYEFLIKNKDRIPKKTLQYGKPFNLS
jgi:uncharacterized protein YbaR (Trm112 family)